MLLEISSLSPGRFRTCRSVAVGIIETKRNLERRLKAMKFIGQKPSTQISLATACLLAFGAVGALPWRMVGRAAEVQVLGDKTEAGQQAVQADDVRADAVEAQGLPKAGVASPGQIQKSVGSLRVFPLRYAHADDVTAHLQALTRGPDANDQPVIVVADRRTNAIIAQAPQEGMDRIASLLQVLDTQSADNAPTAEGATQADESSRPLSIVSLRPGYVQKVFVTVGASVKKGDPLIQLDGQEARGKLDNSEAQLEIAKAALAIQEAEAKGARREYDRVKGLADNHVTSSNEVDAKATACDIAQARIAKAHAEVRLAGQVVNQARADLALLTIRAPKDGKVSRLPVQVGEYVAGGPGQSLLLISP
jgi:biotin carboxyl carrier protein